MARSARGLVLVAVVALVASACGSDADPADPSTSASPETTQTPAEEPSTPTAGDPATAAAALTGYGVGINGTDALYGRLENGTMTTVTTVAGLSLTNAVVRDDGTAWIGSSGRITRIETSGEVTKIAVPGASSGVVVHADDQAVWGFTFDSIVRVDPDTAKLTDTWSLGRGPLPSGVEPVGASGGVLYLSDGAGRITAFDGSKATPHGRLPFPLQGWSFANVPAGLATPEAVYVADLTTGKVAVIDGSAKVTSVQVARPLERDELGRSVSWVADDAGGAWVSFGVPNRLGGGSDAAATRLAHVDATGEVEEGKPAESMQELLDLVDGNVVSSTITGSLLVVDPTSGQEAPIFASLGALLETFRGVG